MHIDDVTFLCTKSKGVDPQHRNSCVNIQLTVALLPDSSVIILRMSHTCFISVQICSVLLNH